MSGKIAILDGDAWFLSILELRLAQAGYDSILASQPGDIDALIAADPPDLLILDTWVEQRDDGWALLQRLWSCPRAAAMPVVICTSDLTALQHHTTLLRERHCTILPKPFAPDYLLATIQALGVKALPDGSPLSARLQAP